MIKYEVDDGLEVVPQDDVTLHQRMLSTQGGRRKLHAPLFWRCCVSEPFRKASLACQLQVGD